MMLYRILFFLACVHYTYAIDYDFSSVDKLLQDSLEQIGGTAQGDLGGAALILWKDGNIIYEKSFNLPNKDVSPTRLMPIASASKWSSGMVIMGLVDAGKLSLDDTCGKFFPTLTGDKAKVTVRQLFSHTSGFPGNLTGPTACVEDLQSDITLSLCVDEVLKENLAGKPGQFLNYGSNSMHIAGRIAEIASGLNLPSGTCWDSLYAHYVTKPLEMDKTSFDVPPVFDTDNPRIDGGVFSTAREYLNIPILILQNGVFKNKRVLSENAVTVMNSDQTRNAIIAFSPYMQYGFLNENLPKTRYGVGCWIEVVNENTKEIEEVSSQGKFGFSPWYDKKRNLAAVLAIKSDLGSAYPTYYRLKQMIRTIIDGTSSIESESNNEGISVFPNPASDMITIRMNQYTGTPISITDVLGRIVWTGGAEQSTVTVSTAGWNPGMYLVSGDTIMKSIMIQH